MADLLSLLWYVGGFVLARVVWGFVRSLSYRHKGWG